jgi:small subunit ribosomal protein S4e
MSRSHVDITTGKMTDIIKFADVGSMVMFTRGHNVGCVGQLMHIERHEGSFHIATIKDTKGMTFSTRLQNVFCIGQGNHPQLTLPKGSVIKKTVLQERTEAEARSEL